MHRHARRAAGARWHGAHPGPSKRRSEALREPLHPARARTLPRGGCGSLSIPLARRRTSARVSSCTEPPQLRLTTMDTPDRQSVCCGVGWFAAASVCCGFWVRVRAYAGPFGVHVPKLSPPSVATDSKLGGPDMHYIYIEFKWRRGNWAARAIASSARGEPQPPCAPVASRPSSIQGGSTARSPVSGPFMIQSLFSCSAMELTRLV